MNDNDIHLIEKYIDGELEGEVLTLFKERLKNDKLLANEYKQRIKFAKLWVDADDYSTTKAQIGNALHNQNENVFRTNRFYIFSIAATIVILIGVYLLFFQKNDTNENVLENQFADVQDSLSNKENTIVFQYDEPDKLAAIDSVSSNINILFPVNGEVFNISQPITFKWKSDLNQNDTLFVTNELDSKILLKLRVRLSDTTYTIKYPQFSDGKYLWYISDKTNDGRFSVISK